MAFRNDPIPPHALAGRVWCKSRDLTGSVADMLLVVAEDLGECWRTPAGIVGEPSAFQRAYDQLIERNPLIANFITEQNSRNAYWVREQKRLDEARERLRKQLGYTPPEMK